LTATDAETTNCAVSTSVSAVNPDRADPRVELRTARDRQVSDALEFARSGTLESVRATGTIGILLTQVQMTGPASTPLKRGFWRYAFGAS
jgi:hypothetical protein